MSKTGSPEQGAAGTVSSAKRETTTDASWVVLARIVRPQGRRGEMLAELLTDFPESFAERKRLFLAPEDGADPEAIREAQLEAYWLHKERVVLKFNGVDSIGDAERLRHFSVMIPLAERMPLEDGAVYLSDLLGAHIVNVGHRPPQDAGEIVDVLPEGAGPAMLVVRTDALEQVLIPFVKAYLKRIDLQAKRIEMELPEGLMTIQAPLTQEERGRLREKAPENE